MAPHRDSTTVGRNESDTPFSVSPLRLIKRTSCALILGAAALLAACSGSDSGSSTDQVRISGIAATGAAIANAPVTAKCTGGTSAGSATTTASGTFMVFAPGALPCVVGVDNGKRMIYSVAAGTGNVVNNLNVTPLTDNIIGQISADTTDYFNKFDGKAAAALTPAALATAQGTVVTALGKAGLSLPAGVTDLLTSPLTVGDAHDKLLDSLATVSVPVKMIALNDFHGNIENPASTNGGQVTIPDPSNPAGTKVNVGGAAYLATLIKSLKAKNANSIVVGAGDLVGAAPFTSTVLNHESTVDVLNTLGLEVTAVGNHEFDAGKTELLRLQNGGCFPGRTPGTDTCLQNGAFSGAKFKWLAANVATDQAGTTLLPATFIKDFGIVRIGFIGLTLKDTPTAVSASGVVGLTFLEESAVINTRAAELKRKGVDAVVVLIHQGGQTTASTLNDKTCPGLSGDILAVMDKIGADVDVVVSGHSHQEYNCNYKGKLLTQAAFYGAVATDIDLTLIPSKGVKAKSADNRPVIQDTTTAALPSGFTKLTKDADMDALVTKYVTLTAPLKNKVVGSITADIKRCLLNNNPVLGRDETCEGTMGDVLADAYLAGSPAADFAMTNPGGVRADLLFATAAGKVTYGDLLTVNPFANTLCTVDMSGQQVIRLLEQQWETPNSTAKTGINGGGRLLQVSKELTYTWDASKPLGAAPGSGARVVVSTVKINGQSIDLAKTYRIATLSFLTTGGDNFTVFAQGKTVCSGTIDIDALVTYFGAKSPVAPPAFRTTRLN